MAATVTDFNDWLSEGMPTDIESFYSLYRVVMGESQMRAYHGFDNAGYRFVKMDKGTMTLHIVSPAARDLFLAQLIEHRGGPHDLDWEGWYSFARAKEKSD